MEQTKALDLEDEQGLKSLSGLIHSIHKLVQHPHNQARHSCSSSKQDLPVFLFFCVMWSAMLIACMFCCSQYTCMICCSKYTCKCRKPLPGIDQTPRLCCRKLVCSTSVVDALLSKSVATVIVLFMLWQDSGCEICCGNGNNLLSC